MYTLKSPHLREGSLNHLMSSRGDSTQPKNFTVCKQCEQRHTESHPLDEISNINEKRDSSPYTGKAYSLLPTKHWQTPALLASYDEISDDLVATDHQSADSLDFNEKNSGFKINYHLTYEQNELVHDQGMSPGHAKERLSEKESSHFEKQHFDHTIERIQSSISRDNEAFLEGEQSREFMEKLRKLNSKMPNENSLKNSRIQHVPRGRLKSSSPSDASKEDESRHDSKINRHIAEVFVPQKNNIDVLEPENIISPTITHDTLILNSPSVQTTVHHSAANSGSKSIDSSINQDPDIGSRGQITKCLSSSGSNEQLSSKRLLLQHKSINATVPNDENNYQSSNSGTKQYTTEVSPKREGRASTFIKGHSKTEQIVYKPALQSKELTLQCATNFNGSAREVMQILNPIELPLQTTTSNKEILVKNSDNLSNSFDKELDLNSQKGNKSALTLIY